MAEHHQDFSRPRTLREYLRLFFTGMAMGAADSVPGVSGGTIAFITGIYETLIDAIKSFNATSIRLALTFKIKAFLDYIPIRFLIALGSGVLIAFFLFANVITGILDNPTGEILLFAFFFGLVLASVLTIGIQVKWGLVQVAMLILGTVVAFIIVNGVPAEGSHDALTIFLSGMIAICAMILPGISGAFILLILGQYDYVLSQVSARNFEPIIILGIGCAVGIIIFSRVLSWTLKRYYFATVAALVGFMVGSLWKIWPWKTCIEEGLDRHGETRCLIEGNLLPNFASSEFVLALLLMLAGFLLVNFIDHLQTGKNPIFGLFWRRRVVTEQQSATM